jgi:hypothetical protein
MRKPIQKYFLLLADQTVIIGSEFQVMKRWRRTFRDKKIVEMLPTNKRVNDGVTSLSKFIEYEPQSA